jgi:hypothetical protein
MNSRKLHPLSVLLLSLIVALCVTQGEASLLTTAVLTGALFSPFSLLNRFVFRSEANANWGGQQEYVQQYNTHGLFRGHDDGYAQGIGCSQEVLNAVPARGAEQVELVRSLNALMNDS